MVDVAGSIAEAAALIEANSSYRLLLLDYELPDARGFGGFFRLQHLLGRVPIAILSAHDSQQNRICRAGRGSGRLPVEKDSHSTRPSPASRSSWPEAASSRAHPAPDDAANDLRKKLDSLSGAQRRVLMALATGDLNKQIAADLGVSEATIKAHLSAIFRKLGVTNRTQAILMMRPLTEPA